MLNIIYRHVFWGENRGGKILTLREKNELREKTFLSSYATLSAESKGRKREEVPCEMRMCFQRDRDRIIHCKSFRRLKHKTQVFLSPEGERGSQNPFRIRSWERGEIHTDSSQRVGNKRDKYTE